MSSAVNPSWWIKLGDNLPPLQRVATLPDGTIVDLTATTLEFRWQLVDNDGVPLSTAPVEVGVAAIVDAINGAWLYNWTPSPSAAGTYAAELQISFAGGAGSMTLPENGWWYFEVIADLS